MDTLLIKTLLCVIGLPTATLIMFGLALQDPDLGDTRFVVTTTQDSGELQLAETVGKRVDVGAEHLLGDAEVVPTGRCVGQ